MSDGHTWRHNHLLDDLYDHLCRPERMLWKDVPMGPSGSVRPDIFSMRKSFTKPRPLVYEVKASVRDFRSDVTSGKWQSYLDFACGVIFACPQGMITKADLPKGCGLMVRSEKGWTTTKAPTLDVFKGLDEAIYLKLLMSLGDKIARDIRTQFDFLDRYNAERRMRESLGKEVAQYLHDKERHHRELQEVIEERSKVLEEIRGHWRELGQALGLESGEKWAIQRRIEQIVDGSFESEHVVPARHAAKRAIETLERVLETLPE